MERIEYMQTVNDFVNNEVDRLEKAFAQVRNQGDIAIDYYTVEQVLNEYMQDNNVADNSQLFDYLIKNMDDAEAHSIIQTYLESYNDIYVESDDKFYIFADTPFHTYSLYQWLSTNDMTTEEFIDDNAHILTCFAIFYDFAENGRITDDYDFDEFARSVSAIDLAFITPQRAVLAIQADMTMEMRKAIDYADVIADERVRIMNEFTDFVVKEISRMEDVFFQ